MTTILLSLIVAAVSSYAFWVIKNLNKQYHVDEEPVVIKKKMLPRWTSEEKQRLMSCELAQHYESFSQCLTAVRDIMVDEGFPRRTLSADLRMFKRLFP